MLFGCFGEYGARAYTACTWLRNTGVRAVCLPNEHLHQRLPTHALTRIPCFPPSIAVQRVICWRGAPNASESAPTNEAHGHTHVRAWTYQNRALGRAVWYESWLSDEGADGSEVDNSTTTCGLKYGERMLHGVGIPFNIDTQDLRVRPTEGDHACVQDMRGKHQVRTLSH